MMGSFNTTAENGYISSVVCECHAAPESNLNLMQIWPASAAGDECDLIVDCEGLHSGLISV